MELVSVEYSLHGHVLFEWRIVETYWFPVSNREAGKVNLFRNIVMKLSYVPRTACLDETVCMLIAGRHSPLLKNARDEIRVIVDAGA
jgi:hypothetical protein